MTKLMTRDEYVTTQIRPTEHMRAYAKHYPAERMVKCSACGHRLQGYEHFCPICGEKLEDDQ